MRYMDLNGGHCVQRLKEPIIQSRPYCSPGCLSGESFIMAREGYNLIVERILELQCALVHDAINQ